MIDETKPYTLFHPIHTWKKRERHRITPCVRCACSCSSTGKCVYQSARDADDIREHCLREVDTLWDQITRFENPQTYFVDLSRKLWELQERAARSLPHLTSKFADSEPQRFAVSLRHHRKIV